MKNSATSGKNPQKGGRRYAILALITASVAAAILLNSCGPKEIPSNTPSASQESGTKPLPTVSSTPTEFVATKVAPTNTLEPTQTPELPEFTEAELYDIAKEVRDGLTKYIPNLKSDTESPLSASSQGNYFQFITMPEGDVEKLIDLVNKFLIIVEYSPESLADIDFEPFMINTGGRTTPLRIEQKSVVITAATMNSLRSNGIAFGIGDLTIETGDHTEFITGVTNLATLEREGKILEDRAPRYGTGAYIILGANSEELRAFSNQNPNADSFSVLHPDGDQVVLNTNGTFRSFFVSPISAFPTGMQKINSGGSFRHTDNIIIPVTVEFPVE